MGDEWSGNDMFGEDESQVPGDDSKQHEEIEAAPKSAKKQKIQQLVRCDICKKTPEEMLPAKVNCNAESPNCFSSPLPKQKATMFDKDLHTRDFVRCVVVHVRFCRCVNFVLFLRTITLAAQRNLHTESISAAIVYGSNFFVRPSLPTNAEHNTARCS